MANKKKTTDFLGKEETIEIVAKRAGYTQGDVRIIIDELRDLFEECILNGTDIDLKGFIHMSITEIEYTKPPGIVKYHNNSDGKFNKLTRRINYRVPANFKLLLKKQNKERE